MNRRRRPSAAPRPAESPAHLSIFERFTIGALLIFIAWSIIQVAYLYPSSFFPRFSDEAIYAFDVRVPSSLFDDYQRGLVRYAPAKLGYGITLAGSAGLFGRDGPMYHSTFWWAATLALLGFVAYRRFGMPATAVAVAFVSYSPMFGKYVAEVGPTTMVAFGFVLLWVTSQSRRWWASGLCLGLIAFIDFKWAIPAALAWSIGTMLFERDWSRIKKLSQIAMSGIVAVSVVGLAMLIHTPYAKFLSEYVFPHSGLVGFEPSPIFFYFLLIFGALPTMLLGVVGLLACRAQLSQNGKERVRNKSLWYATFFAIVPILFYSLFGVHKALRFYAVLLPLLSLPIGFGIALLIDWAGKLLDIIQGWLRYAVMTIAALLIVAVISGFSAGPARHLTLPTGYPEAIERLRPEMPKKGTISSYNWPVVAYGWPVPFKDTPFAFFGLRSSDQWIMLEHVHDRVTIEQRLQVAGDTADADSIWQYQSSILRSVSDSLFSVRSDFYASDYFLSEQVPEGIAVLRRWRALRTTGANYLEVRRIDPERVRGLPTP